MSDRPNRPQDGGGEPEPLDPNAETELVEDDDAGEVELEDEPEPGEGEDPEPGEPEPDPEPTIRRGGPRGRSIGERDREIAELRGQVQTLLSQQRQPAPAAPPQDPRAAQQAEEQFWAEIAQLPYEHQMRAVWNRAQQVIQGQLLNQQLSTRETLDRQSYESRIASSPIHARYRDRVEKMVADERARGNIVDREVALKYIVGEDAINRANGAAPRQRREAATRVQQQQTRPTNSRGDGTARRRPEPGSAEADEALIRDADQRGISIF